MPAGGRGAQNAQLLKPPWWGGGQGEPLKRRWDVGGGGGGGSGWTRAMTSSGAPAALPAPILAAPVVGGRLTAGWATGKEGAEPGGREDARGGGRSLAQPPGGSNPAGREGARQQTEAGRARRAPQSGSHCALPPRHRNVPAGVSPDSRAAGSPPPLPQWAGRRRPPSSKAETALLPAGELLRSRTHTQRCSSPGRCGC